MGNKLVPVFCLLFFVSIALGLAKEEAISPLFKHQVDNKIPVNVYIKVEYTVTDTKSGKTLWKDTVKEYIKKKMTPEESIPLIYDVVTRAFVWRCFGKANLNDSNRSVVM